MKYIHLLLFLVCSTAALAQESDDEQLKAIVNIDNEVTANIPKDVYHLNEITLNSNQKEWGGLEGYVERISCYYEIREDGEVRLVKIIANIQQGKERAYHNFLFNEKEDIIMVYTDYFRDEKQLGQSGSYFGAKNIVAVSVNDKIFIGETLTDEMVKTARKGYLKARKYKQMFITLLSVQLTKG